MGAALSQCAGSSDGAVTSNQTTNGQVVELHAAVAAACAKGALVVLDGVERGVQSIWNDGERGKRLGGAILKCKPGFSPAWYFVPPSRPITAHGLRVAENPGFVQCKVLSATELEERIEVAYLNFLADPTTKAALGLDPAAARHTWRGASGTFDVVVYLAGVPEGEGVETAAVGTLGALELVHGELGSTVRTDLEQVLLELGGQPVPWVHQGSPSRADLQALAFSSARLEWVAFQGQLLSARVGGLEVLLREVLAGEWFLPPMVEGHIRVGVLADLLVGFLAVVSGSAGGALGAAHLAVGMHAAEVERLGAAVDLVLEPSVLGTAARLIEAHAGSLALNAAFVAVVSLQRTDPSLAPSAAGAGLAIGRALATALALGAPGPSSQAGANPSRLDPSSSPLLGVAPSRAEVFTAAHVLSAGARLTAHPFQPRAAPSSSILGNGSPAVAPSPASPAALQRSLGARELEAARQVSSLEAEVLALRAQLTGLAGAPLAPPLAPLPQQATQDQEVQRRARALAQQLDAWRQHQAWSSPPQHMQPPPAPAPLSRPPIPASGFPPGHPHGPPVSGSSGSAHSGFAPRRPPPPPTLPPPSFAAVQPPHASPRGPASVPFVGFLPAPFLAMALGGTAIDPCTVLASLAQAAFRAGATQGELGLLSFMAGLNGGRDLALAQRPVGSARAALIASRDAEVLLAEVLDVLELGPAVAGISASAIVALRAQLAEQPLDWDAAYVKLDDCLSALQLQRAYRVSRNLQLGRGAQGGGQPAGGSDTGHAAAVLGQAVAVFSADAAGADRSSPSCTMVQPLAVASVVIAESMATSTGSTLGEADRQVASYGQRAFAFLFGNGKVHGGRLSGGLPARLVESNSRLALLSRSEIVTLVGPGFDAGPMSASIRDLASHIHVMDWELGVVQGEGGLLSYPRLDTCILVLGGDPSTAEYSTTTSGRSAGTPGDKADPAHVKQAARHLESLMVGLFHRGGRAKVNGAGNFGIGDFVLRCVAMLDLPRAIFLFGTLLMKLHRAMDSARKLLDIGLPPGTCPLDILGVVASVAAVALPIHESRQLSDEAVDARLSVLGLSSAGLQKSAAAAAVAAVGPAITSELKKSRWGPATSFVTADAARASTAAAAAAALTTGAPGPAGAAVAAAWVDTRIDWLSPVRALELALVGTPSAGACPWYSLFGDCRKSRENKCLECPNLLLATQAMVDTVRQSTVGSVLAKVVGLPSGPNPAPGTGAKRKGAP
jgi:hypothetical protein